MGTAFIAGAVLGGLITALVVYAKLKGMYEKEKMESYNKGFSAGREIEQRSILDYIDRLNRDANASTYIEELSRGSEN